jgi:uncharacterized membrane protein YedE/YeeE
MSNTIVSSLAGGAMIGLAAGWLLLSRGRIAGISGLLGQLVPQRHGPALRYAPGSGTAALFLLGLMLAPILLRLLGWQGVPHIEASTTILVIAGLLVGFGTRLGNGCTSGHGVCGIARLSPRSIVATLLFMASAIATVWLQKQLS